MTDLSLYNAIRHGIFLFVLCVMGAVLISSGVGMSPFVWDGVVVTIIGVGMIVGGLFYYGPGLADTVRRALK